MKRRTRTFFLFVLPWCGLIALSAYEGYRYWQSRERDVTERVRQALHPDARGTVQKAELLADDGTFQVLSSEFGYEGERLLSIRVHDKHAIQVYAHEYGKGSLVIEVFADKDFRDLVLACGSQPRAGVFPGYIVVYPRTGPDAGRFSYGDYDLDGKFELRRESLR